jgi:type IV pilus assembly protein PilY1
MRKQHIIGLSAVALSFAGLAVEMLLLPTANAAVCEYPLFIQQGSVDANVMFLFDNSGSMNEAIAHDAYDPKRTYTGTLNPTTDYNVANDGTYSRRSFKSGASTTPTAYLVDSDGGKDGVYSGNYLNWIFQYATTAQRNAIPRFTRIQMAKTAVNDIITNMSTNVRYGVWDFNDDRPASSALATLGTAPATIISRINSVVANSWTPLGETLAAIADYYRTNNSAIQYTCQRNFVVVVTDGYPTQDISTKAPYFDASEGLGNCTSIGAPNPNSDNCSGYLDDVAHWLANNDVRTDLEGTQIVNTYTVGMNVDAPILQWTADDGDGAYFVANNAAQLSTSLQNVIRDILNRISSGSAVAVVSTEGQGDDYLFRGKFLPTSWTGYLEAFVLPYTTGEAPVWEAGQLLSQRSPDSRTIFTSVNGVRQDLTAANVGNLYTAMGVANSTVGTNVINWTRGVNVAGFRDRKGWLLGDIVESAPVTVGRVMGAYNFNNFRSFRNANQNRDRAIYVGANDGMIHAFLASTGAELWAYVPSAALPYLDDIAATNYCHMFTVNGTPRVVDAYVRGQWRTVLIEGQKQGGSTYSALDVTDPHNPVFLWENNLPDIEESWSQVEVTRVQSLNKWVGWVGSGPDATGEAHLIGFDMEDGTQIESDLLSTISGQTNMATAARAVDLNFDGWTDVMYMGDLAGNLWRIGLDGDTIDRTLLFKTQTGQPIQAQPIVTVDFSGKVFVYFGTGRYLDSTDFSTTTTQTFYCIVDDHGGGTVSRTSDLVDQTDAINPIEGFRGWFVDLEVQPGERITEADALVAGVIYFTSYAPSGDVCTAGGHSYLYAMKFRNGAAFDDDDNDGNDTTNGRITDLGEGIATKPVVDIINQHILVQGSDTRIHVEDTQGQIRLLTVRSWRQQY